MTMKISCTVYHIYEKATDTTGPQLCICVDLSFGQLLKLFFAKLFMPYAFLWHEYSPEEVTALSEDIKHWLLVKGLRGYKRRAK